MPLYEEKLISPLALRFTQEHIKTLFRDRHVVEDTVEEIQVRPGVGGYDLLLEAPFPAIEIIRWSARGEDERHWYTLDNRRLYCLQKAAARHWPKRVAAKVEILYADAGHVRRKYDSTTFGHTVTISHSCKEAAIWRWDWCDAVDTSVTGAGAPTAVSSRVGREAWEAVMADDKKETVDALADADAAEAAGGSSAAATLARAIAMEEAAAKGGGHTPKQRVFPRSATPSTAAVSSDDSDSDPSGEVTPRASASEASSHAGRVASQASVAQKQLLQQPQAREAGQRPRAAGRQPEEGLAERAVREITRQLRAEGADGRVRIPKWNERYAEQLGPLRQFLESRPEAFTVIRGRGGQFTVSTAGASGAAPAAAPAAAPTAPAAAPAGAAAGGTAAAATPGSSPQTAAPAAPAATAPAAAKPPAAKPAAAEVTVCRAAAAAGAVAEIEAKLLEQGGIGFAWVKDWNTRYLRQLGPIRNFLESRPDRFVVIPCNHGRGFRVALAGMAPLLSGMALF